MKVQDVMTKDVKTCGPETNLSDAAMEMWMRDCGILPVVDDGGKVVGMITDRDIAIGTGCRRRDPATIFVREVMTGQVHSCSPEADIHEALQTMREKRVRRLPVIDGDGKLCGILSMNDVVLKAQEEGKAEELCARDVQNTLKAICAHGVETEQAAACAKVETVSSR